MSTSTLTQPVTVMVLDNGNTITTRPIELADAGDTVPVYSLLGENIAAAKTLTQPDGTTLWWDNDPGDQPLNHMATLIASHALGEVTPVCGVAVITNRDDEGHLVSVTNRQIAATFAFLLTH